jgi:uncharacterized protein (UPF0276 family)
MLPTIGYALWPENRALLGRPGVNAVEITFERVDDPLREEPLFDGTLLTYVSIHALKLSPASPEPPSRKYLDAIRTLADESDATAISDHLGFTRGGLVELMHFAPPPYTQAALAVTCRNIDRIQSHFLGRPFFLENIATLFHFRGEMTEADFLGRVLDRTGCGWLLDVTNLYANACNHAFDASAFLEQVVPAARRLQMHLSGGFLDISAGRYIDSHSTAIPEEVWDLYRQALTLARGKVDAVFIERDLDFPDEAGWLAEGTRARQIAEEMEACHA